MEKFWGLIVKPNTRYDQQVEHPFKITKVSLDVPSASKPKGVTSLIMKVDNKEYILTHLGPNKLSDTLEVTIENNIEIGLRAKGEGTLHLTGFEMSDEYEEMESFDSCTEVVNEKEQVAKVVNEKKRKLKDAENNLSNSKKQKNNEVGTIINTKAKKVADEDLDNDDVDDSEDDDSFDVEMKDDGEEVEEEEELTEEEEEIEGTDEGSDGEEDIEEDDEEEEEEGSNLFKKKEKDAVSPKKGKPDTNTKRNKSGSESPRNKSKPGEANKNKPGGDTSSKKSKPSNTGKSSDVSTPVNKGKSNGATPKPKKTPKRTLKGGITVEDLKVGSGQEVARGKRIGMYYKGTLATNKKQFDAKLDGKPFEFKLGMGEVIKGWDVGLEGMKVGGKRRLTIPPKMAYGNEKSANIPANSTLVFEVECKHVN